MGMDTWKKWRPKWTKAFDKNISTEEPRLNAVSYQQSTFGAVKTVLYGTNRIFGNIIDCTDLTAIPHTQETQSGKGGITTTSNTTYTYKVRLILGLCYGEIQGIVKVLSSKNSYSLAKLGFNLFKGSSSQNAWGEMLTKHPERALTYRNLAYVAGYIDLGNSTTIPQYSFEVSGKFTANNDDITPVITDGFDYSVTTSYLATKQAKLGYPNYFVSHSNIELIYHDSYGIEHIVNNFTNFSRTGTTYTLNFAGLNAVSAKAYITYNSTVRLDANPKDIILDVLTNPIYGAKFNDFIASFDDYSDFCIASNIFLSPVYNSQDDVREILNSLADITNSSYVWTQGKLKLVPVGDEEISSNGKTWTPNLTPIYNIAEDDLKEEISWTRTSQSDVSNSVKIEFLNRANNYNIDIVEATDSASIELFGKRTADVITAHQICTAEVARSSAQMGLDRISATRNKCTFYLTMKYILLDCMDLITVPKDGNDVLVRILTIQEDDGWLKFLAEEVVEGTATPAKIQHQSNDSIVIDLNIETGNVNTPVIFEPPFQLTQGNLEVNIGVSGSDEYFGGAQVWISDDNTTYKLIGEISTPCRQGLLTSILPISDTVIDSTNILSIDVSESKSTILAGTQADADNLNTLCYVGGELLAYQNADLTDDYKYDLTYLNRGAYNTSIMEHEIGTQFVRIDNGVFLKYPFLMEDIGKKIYIKLPSFNAFGGGYQDLADVSAYEYTITGAALPQSPDDIQYFVVSQNANFAQFNWVAPDGDNSFEIREGSSWNTGIVISSGIGGNQFTTNITSTGTHTYWIKAINKEYGYYSDVAKAAILQVNNLSQLNFILSKKVLNIGGTFNSTVLIQEKLYLNSIEVWEDESPLKWEDESPLKWTYKTVTEGSFYSNPVDIGGVLDNVLSYNYDFVSTDDNSTCTIEFSISKDNTNWTDWTLLASGLMSFRYIKFRVTIKNPLQAPVYLHNWTINIDVPDRKEAYTNREITNASAGITIIYATDSESKIKSSFVKPEPIVIPASKTLNAKPIVIASTADSHTVILENNSGTRVTGIVNLYAEGY